MKKSAIVETVTTGKYVRYIRSSVDATESTVDYRQMVLDNRSGSDQVPEALITPAMLAVYGALYTELYNWSAADRNNVEYDKDKAFKACKDLLSYFGSGIGTGGERDLRSLRDSVVRDAAEATPEMAKIRAEKNKARKEMRELESKHSPEKLETHARYNELADQIERLEIKAAELKDANADNTLERKPVAFKRFRRAVECWIADRINKRQAESIQPPAEKKTRKQRRAEKFGRSISSVAPAELIKVLSADQKAELVKLMGQSAEQAQPTQAAQPATTEQEQPTPAEQVKTPA